MSAHPRKAHFSGWKATKNQPYPFPVSPFLLYSSPLPHPAGQPPICIFLSTFLSFLQSSVNTFPPISSFPHRLPIMASVFHFPLLPIHLLLLFSLFQLFIPFQFTYSFKRTHFSFLPLYFPSPSSNPFLFDPAHSPPRLSLPLARGVHPPMRP